MKIYLPELDIYADICDDVKRFYMFDDVEYFVTEIDGETVAVSESYQSAD